MFSSAIEKVGEFIRPVVITNRHYDESITSSGGTIIVINKDGWFVSAAHVFESIPLLRRHQQEYEDYSEKVTKFKESKASKKELKRLQPNPKWITASSIWPGSNEQKIVDLNVIPEADILLGRLEPFDAASIKEFPQFINPKGEDDLKVGTSLCKMGFAFSEINATFDKAANSFDIDFRNLVPFPLDGIYTRNILFKTPKELEQRNVMIKFLETSTPGLRGHSGGPVFDTKANVWGIQSRTTHLPLGFTPTAKSGDKIVVENQFLNVGWAIHPEVITTFLKERSVEFLTSD